MLKRTNNTNAAGPKVCRSCGAIVGAGEPQCAVCGASVSTQAQPRSGAPDHETLRFAKAILNRPYKFTIILLVANLFVFLLMWQSSGLSSRALWEFPDPILMGYGAKLNWLINQGQWWRFVTPMFVHINLPHVLINMYSLWVVGPYVEKLYGSTKFVVFWVLTGIAGVVSSYLTVRPSLAGGPVRRFLFKAFDVPSAGASGALFGLVGVLFVFGIKFRHELPEGFKRAFGTGLLPIILINLFIGYLGRGVIDNAAHLGGLVMGAVLALAVDYRRPDEKPVVTTLWRVLQVAMIALVGVSFLKQAQHYRDAFQPSIVPAVILNRDVLQFVNYAKAMGEAQEAFFLTLKDRDTTRADAAIKALDEAPQLDETAGELKLSLKSLLTRAKDIVSQDQKDSSRAKQTEQELTNEFVEWSKRYNTWLKTSGRKYGLIEATETTASPK